MIFLVLFMGRHPFAGRYLGDGDMPIEQAIEEHRFAYGGDHDFAAMEQPPGTPPLDIVSPPVAAALRARLRDVRRAGRPADGGGMDRRAREPWRAIWSNAPSAIAHWHFAGLPGCPWCRDRGVDRRAAVLDRHVGGDGRPCSTCRLSGSSVVAIEHPGPAPGITAEAPRSLGCRGLARRLLFRRSWHGTIALFIAIIPAGLSFSVDLPPLGRSFFFLAAVVLYVSRAADPAGDGRPDAVRRARARMPPALGIDPGGVGGQGRLRAGSTTSGASSRSSRTGGTRPRPSRSSVPASRPRSAAPSTTCSRSPARSSSPVCPCARMRRRPTSSCSRPSSTSRRCRRRSSGCNRVSPEPPLLRGASRSAHDATASVPRRSYRARRRTSHRLRPS